MRINHLHWLLVAALLLGAYAPWAQAAEPVAGAKKGTLATFVLREDYPEGSSAPGLFGELETNLRDVITRIEAAGKDEKIAGVVIELRGAEIGLGKTDEIRAAISHVRKSGKKVYADLTAGTNRDYRIASACDEIIMPPAGMLMITGLRAEVTFFKNLFDKLGIQAEMIQIGDFKGAAEPYTRSEMSPEFRKQFEAVIDDYYQQMIKTIAEDRKIDPAKVKELIDVGMFTAEAAREAHLIDRVCYQDELTAQLKTDLKVDDVTFDRKYGKKKLDTDFSGFGGIMKLMEAIMGGDQNKPKSKNPKVAVIYAVGVIMPGESESGLMGGSVLGGDTIVKAFRKAAEDDTVKAIVLRVDSPGGSALASDLIWREITQSKKPVVASMGDVAASGGYYISMGTKKIFVEPGTLTGSIGVVGGKVALKGLMDKIGVTTDVIGRGKNSGVMSLNEPMTPSEREAWKRLMTDIYKQFTTKAAAGRHMDVAKLETVAQGALFTGRQAVENGLADNVGTLADAIASAKEMAGLAGSDQVEIITMPEHKTFIETLFSEGGADALAPKIAARGLGGPVGREVSSVLNEAELFSRLFAEPAALVLPCVVHVK